MGEFVDDTLFRIAAGAVSRKDRKVDVNQLMHNRNLHVVEHFRRWQSVVIGREHTDGGLPCVEIPVDIAKGFWLQGVAMNKLNLKVPTRQIQAFLPDFELMSNKLAGCSFTILGHMAGRKGGYS